VTHALAGLGTHNVRVEENVSDIVHVNHHPALVTFLLQQDTEQHGVLCVRISCICFTYNQCEGCSRGQTSPSRVFSYDL
jgi:hypothetical protein